MAEILCGDCDKTGADFGRDCCNSAMHKIHARACGCGNKFCGQNCDGVVKIAVRRFAPNADITHFTKIATSTYVKMQTG